MPHKSLRKYIHSYFYFRNDSVIANIKDIFSLPSGGGSDLIINLGDPIYSGAEPENLIKFHGIRVVGTLSRNFSIKPVEKTAYVVVRFLPGQIPSFFNVPANKITDMTISLECLWGASGKILEEKLISNSDNISKVIMLLDSAFLKLLPELNSNDCQIHAAIKTILYAKGQVNIANIAKEIKLSCRQFERRFMNVVGITPKRFSRIIRFRSMFSYLRNYPQQGWADVAAACGYSDQAHLVRENKFFTGYSPEAYLQKLSPLEYDVLSVDLSMSYFFNT